ncbi:MAG: PA2779 family protein [Gammaproteobacteria bacterium]|jgi:siroheme synthase|nr:PA2779 family protein [Gammaproteobacteria bacterium]
MTYFKKLTFMVLLSLSASSVFAAMVPTDQLTNEPTTAQLSSYADQRKQVTQQMIEHGLDPAEATRRVNQMTDQQISAVQGKISELPAGAGVSTTNLLLIIILVILLL